MNATFTINRKFENIEQRPAPAEVKHTEVRRRRLAHALNYFHATHPWAFYWNLIFR